MFFLSTNCAAQTEKWKTKITDHGKISVKYSISERADENGTIVPLIEDIATTTAAVAMQNCISLMKNISRHREFTGDAISKNIRTVSENEWIIYFYSDNPWPIADSDCAARMSFSEDKIAKTATFTITAAPEMYEKQRVKRMTYYNVTYTFKDLGNGNVEITLAGKSSPAVKVPRWVISAAFPGAPADGLRKFVELAKTIQ